MKIQPNGKTRGNVLNQVKDAQYSQGPAQFPDPQDDNRTNAWEGSAPNDYDIMDEQGSDYEIEEITNQIVQLAQEALSIAGTDDQTAERIISEIHGTMSQVYNDQNDDLMNRTRERTEDVAQHLMPGRPLDPDMHGELNT